MKKMKRYESIVAIVLLVISNALKLYSIVALCCARTYVSEKPTHSQLKKPPFENKKKAKKRRIHYTLNGISQ